jgi:GTP-binding protein HflX
MRSAQPDPTPEESPLTQPDRKPKPRSVLVGLQLPGVSDEDHQASLAELSRLVHTLGFTVTATVTQKRTGPVTATVIGAGKLKELARLTGGTGIVASQVPETRRKREAREDVEAEAAPDPYEPELEPIAEALQATIVIFDSELTPNQLRNLESATGAEVLDRTGVIVEIFHRHAKTREARLQVEIAKLKYLAPRLRQARGGADRQAGGIGAKGAGESAHELDRRRIRDRIAELSRELDSIQVSQEERRGRRAEQARVALVGYTNAGKSSLMRALTGSEVLVQDKLFATLDTTIRAMHPPSQPRILISDTVGFIKKLPHDLVASFRSTLDEAAEASLLLFVVDASDKTFRSQLQVTREVLGDIGVDTAASKLILNKIDRLSEDELAALRLEFPDAIALSAQRPADVAALREQIIAFFEADMSEDELHVPYSRSEVLGEIRRHLRVLQESYDETGTVMRVRGHRGTIDKLVKLLQSTQ